MKESLMAEGLLITITENAPTPLAEIKQLKSECDQYKNKLAEMERDQRQMRMLLSLVEVISSELDLKTLLQKMIVSAVELLGAEQGAIGLVDEQRQAVRHQALYNLPEELFEVEFKENVGISGQVYALKRPVIVQDYGHDVQIPIDSDRMRRIKAAICVPIWWQERLIGVFSIGTNNPERIFAERDVEVLCVFAKHAAVAIENARLYGEADRLAQLEERNRLARELHDSVTQSLFTIVLMADAVRNFVYTGHERAAPTTELLYQAARDTLTEMRALIYELRPAALEGEGLITALRKLASAFQTRHGLPIEVRQYGARPLSQTQEEALFRIAQEALYNVVKHAQASRAAIELHLADDLVRLIVEDNGVGLQGQDAPSDDLRQLGSSGLGFSTMRERAEQLGGQFSLNPTLGRGLQVRVSLPL